MKVWVTQPGAGDDAAMKVVLPDDADVSDLLQACVPLFLFGPRGSRLIATQLQICTSAGPLPNRQPLKGIADEADTLLVQPRPPQRAATRARVEAPAATHRPGRAAGPPTRSTSAPRVPATRSTSRPRSGGGGFAFGSSRPRFSAAEPPEPANGGSAGSTRIRPRRKPAVPITSTSSARTSASPQRPRQGYAARMNPVAELCRAEAAAAAAIRAGGSPAPAVRSPNGGSGTRGSPKGGGWVEGRLRQFYARHGPTMLESVDKLVQKYSGQEEELWRVLLQKHKLTETTWRTAAPSQQTMSEDDILADLLSGIDHVSPTHRPRSAASPRQRLSAQLEEIEPAQKPPPLPSPRKPADTSPLQGLLHLQQLCGDRPPAASPPGSAFSAVHPAGVSETTPPHRPGRGRARELRPPPLLTADTSVEPTPPHTPLPNWSDERYASVVFADEY